MSNFCNEFKLIDQFTEINLSQSKKLDFKMVGIGNKSYKTIVFYVSRSNIKATDITGNIYDKPFSFGGAFPGIDPAYLGCSSFLPSGPGNSAQSCHINLEFNPFSEKHYMSTFVLEYYVQGQRCTQIITLRGQGINLHY